MEFVIQQEARKVLEQELRKARQQRQKQVRQQSLQWSEETRRKYENEKQKQTKVLINSLTLEAEKHAKARIEHLLMTHDLAMAEVGAAHRAAAHLRDAEKSKELKRLQDQQVAKQRGQAALGKSKSELELKSQARAEMKQRKDEIRKQEDIKSKELIKDRIPLSATNSNSLTSQQKISKTIASRPRYDQSAASKLKIPSKTSTKVTSSSKNVFQPKSTTSSIPSTLRSGRLDKEAQLRAPVSTSKPAQIDRLTGKSVKISSPTKKTKIKSKIVPVKTKPTKPVIYYDSSIPKSESQYISPIGLGERETSNKGPSAWEIAKKISKENLTEVEEKARKQEEMLRKANSRGIVATKKAKLQNELTRVTSELMAGHESFTRLGSGHQSTMLGLDDISEENNKDIQDGESEMDSSLMEMSNDEDVDKLSSEETLSKFYIGEDDADGSRVVSYEIPVIKLPQSKPKVVETYSKAAKMAENTLKSLDDELSKLSKLQNNYYYRPPHEVIDELTKTSPSQTPAKTDSTKPLKKKKQRKVPKTSTPTNTMNPPISPAPVDKDNVAEPIGLLTRNTNVITPRIAIKKQSSVASKKSPFGNDINDQSLDTNFTSDFQSRLEMSKDWEGEENKAIDERIQTVVKPPSTSTKTESEERAKNMPLPKSKGSQIEPLSKDGKVSSRKETTKKKSSPKKKAENKEITEDVQLEEMSDDEDAQKVSPEDTYFTSEYQTSGLERSKDLEESELADKSTKTGVQVPTISTESSLEEKQYSKPSEPESKVPRSQIEPEPFKKDRKVSLHKKDKNPFPKKKSTSEAKQEESKKVTEDMIQLEEMSEDEEAQKVSPEESTTNPGSKHIEINSGHEIETSSGQSTIAAVKMKTTIHSESTDNEFSVPQKSKAANRQKRKTKDKKQQSQSNHGSATDIPATPKSDSSVADAEGPFTSTPDGQLKLKKTSSRLEPLESKRNLILGERISRFLLKTRESIDNMSVSTSSSSRLAIDSTFPSSNELSSFLTSSSGKKSTTLSTPSSSRTWQTILAEQLLLDDSATEKTGTRNSSSTSGTTIGEVHIQTFNNTSGTGSSSIAEDVTNGTMSSTSNSSNTSLIKKLSVLDKQQAIKVLQKELNELKNEEINDLPAHFSPGGSDPTRENIDTVDDGAENDEETSTEVPDASIILRELRNRHSENRHTSPDSNELPKRIHYSDKELQRIQEFIGDFNDCGDIWSSPPVNGTKDHAEIVSSVFEEFRDELASIPMFIERPPWSSSS